MRTTSQNRNFRFASLGRSSRAGPPAAAAPPASPAPAVPKIKNLGIAHRDEETEEERASRARVPSWDDILMGVRRKKD